MAVPAFRRGVEFARELDGRDPLGAFRDRFRIPKTRDGGDEIYLCGNSLGLQPKLAADYVREELD
jgi:kynureninase